MRWAEPRFTLPLALALAAASPVPRKPVAGHFLVPQLPPAPAHAAGSVVGNPGFESGRIDGGWFQCGDVPAYVTTAHPFRGRYDEYSGTARGNAEPLGNSGVCQRVTIPRGGVLTAALFRLSDEADTTYAYQEADLLDARGNVVVNLYKAVDNASAWQPARWNLSAYAGHTYFLYFGVHGDGYAGLATEQFVDEVSLAPAHE